MTFVIAVSACDTCLFVVYVKRAFCLGAVHKLRHAVGAAICDEGGSVNVMHAKK